MIKLASFNMENLFDRAKAMNLATWADGKETLDEYARLNKIFNKTFYSAADKTAIRSGLSKLGLLKSDTGGKYALLRQNRGKLLKRPAGKPVEVVANGRGDWIGWIELKTEPVSETAILNTARVVRDVGADIFGVIEVDNRIALTRFNQQVLPVVGGALYEHIMLIDGNDDRGIDVGIITRADIPIVSMLSHVDDMTGAERIFSRDCAEYDLLLPGGGHLLVLVNHLKSKGYGTPAVSNAKREAQARRIRAIYDARRTSGVSRIAVIGDFNDTPDSAPLAPLLASGSDLKDVSAHPSYQNDGHPGTFENGSKNQKIDYILLSPALFAQVNAAGVFRKGVWGGTHGTMWPIYPEIVQKVHAASDHAAIWVELNI